MEISHSTFLTAHIPSTISPRYTQKYKSDSKENKKENSKVYDPVKSPQVLKDAGYTWSFKITLNTTQKLIFWASTTHELKEIYQNEEGKQTVLVMP